MISVLLGLMATIRLQPFIMSNLKFHGVKMTDNQEAKLKWLAKLDLPIGAHVNSHTSPADVLETEQVRAKAAWLKKIDESKPTFGEKKRKQIENLKSQHEEEMLRLWYKKLDRIR